MSRDLYGEMLARTLNRGAPPGHSAAYITPQEGGILRAFGGGVPPGGGQYMANGIPSFQEAGFDDPGISNPTGPTGGLGSAGHEMGQGTRGFQPGRGMAAAEQAQRDAGIEGRAHSLDDMFSAAAMRGPQTPSRTGGMLGAELTGPLAVGRVAGPLHAQAALNMAQISRNERNRNADGTLTDIGRAAVNLGISRGGIGSESPGATLANNNPDATIDQVASVNQHSDRTGGYSVNDPYDNVSVPAGMNMGVIPSLLGTIAGFGHPIIGLPMMLSGYPTLGRMALNAARADTGMIGTAARGFQTNVTDPINRAFDAITQPITQPIEQLGGFLGGRVRAGASAVGDFIDENVVDPFGQFATGLGEDITGALPDFPDFSIGDVLSQGETPVGTFQDPQAGGNQEVFVPPQPAPVTEPFVSDDTERQFADIPPEVLARILANEKFGRERVGLA